MLGLFKGFVRLTLVAFLHIALAPTFAQPSGAEEVQTGPDAEVGCRDVDCSQLRPWASVTDTPVDPSALDRFPDFVSRFFKTLDHRFENEFKGQRMMFLVQVEENAFQSTEPGVGHLETKLIDGQVAVKFVPLGVKDPIAAIFYNVPLKVNENARKIGEDSEHLKRYVSKLVINVRRSVVYFDVSHGQITPENSRFERRSSFLAAPAQMTEHWIRATIQMPKPGNISLAVVSAPIQLLLAVGAVHMAHWLIGKPIDYYAPIAAGLFALTLCTFSDIYNNIVERGRGILTGENSRRFVIGLALTVPIWGHQHGWDSFHPGEVANWLPGGTYFTLFLLGWTDRWSAVTWNQIFKDMHDKFRLSPWFGIPKRVPMPFRSALARLFGDPKLNDATIKGSQVEREASAVLRFIPKILTILVAPIAGNIGLVAWALGGELATHISADRYAREKPQMEEIAYKYAWRRHQALRWIPFGRKIADRWAERPIPILKIQNPFRFRFCANGVKALGSQPR